MWFLFEANRTKYRRAFTGGREIEAEAEESVESKQETSADTSITAERQAKRGEGGKGRGRAVYD